MGNKKIHLAYQPVLPNNWGIVCPFPQRAEFVFIQIKLKGVWRAGNLTAFIHSSTGPVVHPFASRYQGPRFNPQGGTYVNRDSPVSVVLLQEQILSHQWVSNFCNFKPNHF